MNLTEEQATAAALAICKAVGDAIRELREVPSGILYAQLANVIDHRTYTAIIEQLKAAGLIKVENFLIRWVGP